MWPTATWCTTTRGKEWLCYVGEEWKEGDIRTNSSRWPGGRMRRDKGEWLGGMGFWKCILPGKGTYGKPYWMKSSTGSWRRSLWGRESVIWWERVLYVKFRKQQLNHGGARWQEATTEIYLTVRVARWRTYPCSLCSSGLGTAVWGWAKPRRRSLECVEIEVVKIWGSCEKKKSAVYLAGCVVQRRTERAEWYHRRLWDT